MSKEYRILLKEVRFAGQACVELSEKNKALKINNRRLTKELREIKRTKRELVQLSTQIENYLVVKERLKNEFSFVNQTILKINSDSGKFYKRYEFLINSGEMDMPETMNEKVSKESSGKLWKVLSDEQVYGYFKNGDRSKFKYQEALFDIIVGKFVNRQSDTTNFEMNHQVYCCVKIGSRSKSKSKSEKFRRFIKHLPFSNFYHLCSDIFLSFFPLYFQEMVFYEFQYLDFRLQKVTVKCRILLRQQVNVYMKCFRKKNFHLYLL